MSNLLQKIAELSPEKRALLLQKLNQQKGKVSETKIKPHNRDTQTFPLSFAQQRLWFISQLEPQSSAYNIPTAIRLKGKLNVAALENSINEIVRRHEILRTTFAVVDGEPVQVIDATAKLPLQIIDLQTTPETEQETEALRLVTLEAQTPFNLEKDLLLRVSLLRLGETDHVILFTMHHIVSDGWSAGILIREMTTLYTAYSSGQPHNLPELPIQYVDFAVWQRQWLQGEVLNTQLNYWKQQLGGDLPVLELPTDRPRPAIQTNRGANEFFLLSQSLTAALKNLSQQEGVTLFMTLLAAFKVLLYRYTQQEDIIVGTPIANRNRSEIEGLIGFFINTLVLRTNLANNLTVRELLQQVREVTLAAYAHQELPFERLVEELQPGRDLSHSPLFQVMFVLENATTEVIRLPELTLQPLTTEKNTAKFDIVFFLSETDEGLQGILEYKTDIFDNATITRMLGHFQVLLEGIVANPQQRLSGLPLLTANEQHQILVEWNNTEIDYPQEQCIHQLFEAQVEKTPDAVAVVFQNQQLIYRELNSRANQLANYLQTLGVGPEVIVGICMERSVDLAIALLAILKAGSAYLPLDPLYPEERLKFMLENSQASILLTQNHLLETLPTHNIHCICLDSHQQTIAQYSISNLDSAVTANNLAYVIYTSGSTGQPKGVAMLHLPLVNLITWQLEHTVIGAAGKTLQFTPISFDVSFQEIFSTFASGGTLVLISEEMRRDPLSLLNYINETCIERLFLPFVALKQIAEVGEAQGIIPPSLREVIVAGEQLRITSSISNWFKQLQNCTLHNHYGPSESHVVTAFNLTGLPKNWPVLPAIGSPIANTQIYLLDSQLQPVPVNVPGELYIGGVSLARGYLNRSDLTAEKFIPNPFSPKLGERLYKTGDQARYLPNGNIEFLGRIDQQTKIRGFRIEPREIEAVLEQHLLVRQAIVIVREDIPEDKRLVAYIVPNKENMQNILKVDELRGLIQQHLPSYMMPSAFVVLESLPLTPSGKVDSRRLPAPETKRSEIEAAFVNPRSEIEKTLARIWSQVLGLEKVCIHDNFFELGGHSLLTTRLMLNIQETLQVDLPLRVLFESPTVAALAERIEQIIHAQASTTVSQEIVENLKDEAILDSTIIPEYYPVVARTKPNRIFLTGATGFLGAFLLYELLQQTQAEIYCLVRSANAEEGKKKLQKSLADYLIWNDNFNTRIIPVIGDLSEPLLGLSEDEFQQIASTVDVIYHNGAWVHHIYPYSILKAANVIGTQEVLRLASKTKVKPVHFISTVGVLSSLRKLGVKLFREEDSIDDIQELDNGYVQTKWVAEKIVNIARERGIPVCIYRLSRISGHSQTGVFNVNDFLYKLIIGCIQLGSVSDGDIRENIIPIDYASKAIVHLSQQDESLGKNFHLVHHQTLHSSQLIEHIRSLGYPIEQICYDRWREKLLNITQGSREHPLYSLVPFFPARQAQRENSSSEFLQLDNQNVINGLVDTSITCPPVDDQLLNVYFSHLINQGLLANQV